MFKIVLFVIIVISFYVITIWQYRNPTKAISLSNKKAYLEDPRVDEELVRRSIKIRAIFFSIAFIIITLVTFAS